MSDRDDTPYVPDCPCMICRGSRDWERYLRTGQEPFWPAVRAWRSREAWLASASVTTRRGLSGPRRKPEDA